MTPGRNTLTLQCGECGANVDESAALAFGGWLACEKCVRAYFRDRPAAEVDRELRERRHLAANMLKSDPSRFQKPPARKDRTTQLTAEMEKLPLLCCECGTTIHASTAFQFHGDSVACEKCVRDYYRDRPAEIEAELQSRHRNALAWIRRNWKTLAKRAAQRE